MIWYIKILIILIILIIFIISVIIFKLICKYKSNILKKKYHSNKHNTAIILITKPYRQNLFRKLESFLTDEVIFLKDIDLEKVLQKFDPKQTKLYININSNNFENIIKNKEIKEVYIYSHGSRYGVFLVDKYYEYKNLNKYKIPEKDYIAQIHCGHISKKYPKGITLEKFTKNIFYFDKKVRIINAYKYYNHELIKGNKLKL